MKAVRTLIVLASEAQMRLFENAGVGKGLQELRSVGAADFDDTVTRYADAPGRGQGAPGMAGHGLARPSDERTQRRASFATHILAEVEAVWGTGSYDRLILAAAPKLLGVLRAGLSPALSGALLADFDKDLTGLPVQDLPDHFAKVIAL